MDEKARKQPMDQQERFAVAMIGFALENDRGFAAHFLEKVCALNDLSSSMSQNSKHTSMTVLMVSV